jgi:aldehyde dehydrogenase (NAD+)
MQLGLEAIVRQQRIFFSSGHTWHVSFRQECLRALDAALEQHEPLLLEALHADLRKSPYQAQATELGPLRAELQHALRHLHRWVQPERRRVPWLTWPARAWIQPEPRGVVLILGPWNYPVSLALTPLVSALAAGNCVVLKPSERAPATAQALQRLIHQTFLPEHVNVVLGGPEVAQALVQQQFDALFYTGNTAVGRQIMAAAAPRLIPVTLELGGKCPCLVCADAHLESAARRIVWGKFLNAGQTCVAPDFVWVDRTVLPTLLQHLVDALRTLYGDQPRTHPEYGRIVNVAHFDRLLSYLTQGRIAHGGEYDRNDLYLAPTLLVDVPRNAPVLQEEIFGPILPVIEFATLEEVFAELQRRPVPLALYLFTQDRQCQKRVLEQVRSGGVCLNDTVLHAAIPTLPFGGLGESGVGSYHGKAGFDTFSHMRSVLQRSARWELPFRYPPRPLGLQGLKRALRVLLRV